MSYLILCCFFIEVVQTFNACIIEPKRLKHSRKALFHLHPRCLSVTLGTRRHSNITDSRACSTILQKTSLNANNRNASLESRSLPDSLNMFRYEGALSELRAHLSSALAQCRNHQKFKIEWFHSVAIETRAQRVSNREPKCGVDRRQHFLLGWCVRAGYDANTFCSAGVYVPVTTPTLFARLV